MAILNLMLRKGLKGIGALLVLFHVWLFAGQALDGNLLEAGRLARWLIAAGIALGLVSLRRRSGSIFRGRKAVAIWLLAAMLHGPAIAQRLDDPGAWMLQQLVATLTQISIASAGCVLALVAWLIARSLAAPLRRAVPLARCRTRAGPPWAHGFLFAVPRPPPLA